jgi:hypothetical protein
MLIAYYLLKVLQRESTGPLDHVRLSLGRRPFCSIERSIGGIQQALCQGSQRVGQMVGASVAQRSRSVFVLPQQIFSAIQLSR